MIVALASARVQNPAYRSSSNGIIRNTSVDREIAEVFFHESLLQRDEGFAALGGARVGRARFQERVDKAADVAGIHDAGVTRGGGYHRAT